MLAMFLSDEMVEKVTGLFKKELKDFLAVTSGNGRKTRRKPECAENGKRSGKRVFIRKIRRTAKSIDEERIQVH